MFPYQITFLRSVGGCLGRSARGQPWAEAHSSTLKRCATVKSLSSGGLGAGGLGGDGKAIALRVEMPGVFRTNKPKVGRVKVFYDLQGCVVGAVSDGEGCHFFQVFLFEGAALGLHF